jgi:hypothetical protein
MHSCQLLDEHIILDRVKYIWLSQQYLNAVPLRFRGLLKDVKQTSLLTNQIPAELIQEGDRTVCSATHKLIRCICSNEELPQQRKQSLYLFTRRVMKQSVVITAVHKLPSTCKF